MKNYILKTETKMIEIKRESLPQAIEYAKKVSIDWVIYNTKMKKLAYSAVNFKIGVLRWKSRF